MPKSKNKKPIITHKVTKFVKSTLLKLTSLDLSNETALSENGLIVQRKIEKKAAVKPNI